MHFSCYITSNEAEISLRKQKGSTYLFRAISCSQSNNMAIEAKTQPEIFRNRGQQPASHAGPLTSYRPIHCQTPQTEPANGDLEI